MTKKKKASKVEKSTMEKGPTELSDDDLAKVDGGTALGGAAPADPSAPTSPDPGGSPDLNSVGLFAYGGGGGEGKQSFNDLTFTKTPIRRPPG